MLTDPASRLASVTMIGLPDAGLTPEFRAAFAARPWAGVLLFRRHFESLAALPGARRRLRALAAPRRILVAVDEEGGFVSQLAPELPVPPAARVLGRAASELEIERIAATVGGWLCALGVDVNFAPVLDVDSDAAQPGHRPALVRPRAARVARAARGRAARLPRGRRAGLRQALPGARRDGRRLAPGAARRATPTARRWRRASSCRSARRCTWRRMVMTAHVRYPALDPALPATLSPAILGGLLRGTLGARNVVVTDCDGDEGRGRPRARRRRAAGRARRGLRPGALRRVDAGARRLAGDGGRALEAAASPCCPWRAGRPRAAASRACCAAALAAERFAKGDAPRDRVGRGRAGAPRAAVVGADDARHLPPRAVVAGPPGALALDRLEVLEPAWAAGPSIAELLLEAGVPARGRAFAGRRLRRGARPDRRRWPRTSPPCGGSPAAHRAERRARSADRRAAAAHAAVGRRDARAARAVRGAADGARRARAGRVPRRLPRGRRAPLGLRRHAGDAPRGGAGAGRARGAGGVSAAPGAAPTAGCSSSSSRSCPSPFSSGSGRPIDPNPAPRAGSGRHAGAWSRRRRVGRFRARPRSFARKRSTPGSAIFSPCRGMTLSGPDELRRSRTRPGRSRSPSRTSGALGSRWSPPDSRRS